ncbi:hypothetical protein ACFPM3_26885 [Streptomyces coeruleoprunus]|uniref:Uncharacterized protein n=1 Tax=Streptomyces coeruleoprunus TaxID=285563 RepID=A0ABV9XN32_9ACTN
MLRRRVPLPALTSALVPSVLLVLLVCGGVLWWWAVLRLVMVPERVGVVEGAVVASGWGLSLLPVHVAGAPTARVSRRPRWLAAVRDSFPEALRGVVWDVVRAVRRPPSKERQESVRDGR